MEVKMRNIKQIKILNCKIKIIFMKLYTKMTHKYKNITRNLIWHLKFKKIKGKFKVMRKIMNNIFNLLIYL